MTEPRHRVDADPDTCYFIFAMGTVTFKLACGCTTRYTGEPDEIYLFMDAGCIYECPKHGEVIITRSTKRLTGWRKPKDAMEKRMYERFLERRKQESGS